MVVCSTSWRLKPGVVALEILFWVVNKAIWALLTADTPTLISPAMMLLLSCAVYVPTDDNG